MPDMMTNDGIYAVVAFGFHVLASMLLLAYKPRPRFALRKTNEATTAEADVEASLAYYA